jgi:hypothetical protein
MVGTLQLVMTGMRHINRADFVPSSRIPKTICSKPVPVPFQRSSGNPAKDRPLESVH